MRPAGYQLVALANGVCSLHSLQYGETMHPSVGPVAEAEALYIRQLKVRERLVQSNHEFVIWDVGLGGAANVLTVLRATRDIACPVRVVSFDDTLEPLRFAQKHKQSLVYFNGYEEAIDRLLAGAKQDIRFTDGIHNVAWEIIITDFPTLLGQSMARKLAKPDAILFDPFSPAKNPAMWTLPLFTNLFRLLDPARPCALATYSRSTMNRVGLLLAGFHVGVGEATGLKEETTVAANTPGLIDEPLDETWLERARRSDSAEPLSETVYHQARLSPETWERLQQHPQFA